MYLPTPCRISRVTDVTDDSFEQDVLRNHEAILVHFWAPWVSPSRQVASVLDQIADEYQGRLKIYKLNADENPLTTDKYNIRSMPALILFKCGVKVDTVVGSIPKSLLLSTLIKHNI